MRFIASALGISAVRFSADDVLPERGVLQRELIARVTERYAFHVSPPVGPGLGLQQVLIFQSGVLGHTSGPIPIIQLSIFPDGIAAIAKDTDLAEAVLNDVMAECDSAVGYRYGVAQLESLYLSQLVVEFSAEFIERTAAFQIIRNTLDGSLCNDRREVHLKRLVFGLDLANETQMAIQQVGIQLPGVVTLVPRDFVIERRMPEPMERNRFFCAAPIRTKEHRVLLETIERDVVASNAN